MAAGGLQVLDEHSTLTVGDLITFQLYANMLTTAYQVPCQLCLAHTSRLD